MRIRTRLLVAATAAVLVAGACSGGGDGTGSSNDGRLAPTGVTFTITPDDDGTTLVVRPGDEILADLPLETESSPDWLVSAPPDPAVLSEGSPQRFLPSEAGDRPAQFFISFVAQEPGTTTVGLSQGPGGESGTVTFTVEVVAPDEG